MRRFAPFISLLAATLLIMTVAFVNGRPSVFYDSHSYDVMGRNLIQVVQDFPESLEFKMKPGVRWGDSPVNTDRLVDAGVEGARSPYYGLLMHGAWQIGTLWLLAAIQSFLAAWVIYLLWRSLAPRAPAWSYVALIAGVVLGSSLPFFATFAMPDVFAGIGAGALALLVTQWDKLGKGEKVGLWLLLVFSLTIHRSHLLTGLGVGCLGLAALWLLGEAHKKIVRRAVLFVAALTTAVAFGAAFDMVYKARTGLTLAHPPFLMARVVADGPGRDYLWATCAKNPDAYALCRYSHNVRRTTENLILWSTRPKAGVFNIANRANRVRLENEEMRFVFGVLAYDPMGQLSASLQDWGEQLVSFTVDDPLRNPADYLIGRYWPTTSIPHLIPNFQACRPPHSCKPPFAPDILGVWHEAVVVLSLLGVVGLAVLPDLRGAFRRRALAPSSDPASESGAEPARVILTLALLLAAVALNAAVCGVLSGPFNRYQARVIWLAPLAAGLALCASPAVVAAIVSLARDAFAFGNRLWEKLRARPGIGRLLPSLTGHFPRFCMVGALGFIVDYSVLKVMVFLGLNWLSGRAVSFPVAVLATWLANRLFTFKARAQQSKVREASTYFAVQSVGGLANFAAYAAVAAIPALHDRLFVALAFGAAAGLIINYLGAKYIVFGHRAAAP